MTQGTRTRTRFARWMAVGFAALLGTADVMAQWTYAPGSPGTITRMAVNGGNWVFNVTERPDGPMTYLTVGHCSQIPPVAELLDFSGTISDGASTGYAIETIGNGSVCIFGSIADADKVSALTLPNTLTTIADNAFAYLRQAKGDLIIPASVVSIGDFAFQRTKFAYSTFGTGNGQLIFTGAENNTAQLKTIGMYAFGSDAYFSGDLVIPGSVTNIGMAAFYDCKFYGGGKLQFGAKADGSESSLETIGDSAFYVDGPFGYNFKGELYLPDTVKHIGQNAFGYQGLSRIFLPSTGVGIGHQAFSFCSSLTGVYYKGEHPQLLVNGINQSGIFYNSSSVVTSFVLHAHVPTWDPNVTSGGLICNGSAYWMYRPIRCSGHIMFHGNGGSPATQQGGTTDAFLYDFDSITPPLWTGHSLIGWNMLANGNGATVNGTTLYTGGNNVYAQWLQEELITFHGNGGSPDPQSNYTKYLAYSLDDISDLTRPGYVFSGWTNSLGATVSDGDTYVTGENDLYAVWIPEISVRYYDNNGTSAYQTALTLNFCYDLNGLLYTPTSQGLTPHSWNTQPNGRGMTCDHGDGYAGDLYAQYYDNWDDDVNRDKDWPVWATPGTPPGPGIGAIPNTPGTIVDYYIYTAEELAQFAWTVSNGQSYFGDTVHLMDDIDLESFWWTSAGGYGTTAFQGTFNGNHRTIRGLRIGEKDRSNQYQGLFAFTQAPILVRIHDLTLEVSSFEACGGIVAASTGIYAGALVGFVVDRTQIDNVTVAGGPGSVLSFVGGRQPGELKAGGLVGVSEGMFVQIRNCTNLLPIAIAMVDTGTGASMSVYAGGLVGFARGELTVADCKNWGTVTEASVCPDVTFKAPLLPLNATVFGMGGIVGHFQDDRFVEVLRCVNEGVVNSGAMSSAGPDEAGIGGIIGYSSAGDSTYIDNCHNRGSIVAGNVPNTGGIVGFIQHQALIVNGSNCGEVSGNNPGGTIGGIVGTICNDAWIQNCWNSRSIRYSGPGSGIRIGGIAGELRDTNISVENCYSSGDVAPVNTANPNVKPLIGNAPQTWVEYCYWLYTGLPSQQVNVTMFDGIGNWSGNGGQFCGTFITAPGTPFQPVAGATLLVAASLERTLDQWVVTSLVTPVPTPPAPPPGTLIYERWTIQNSQQLGGNGYPVFGNQPLLQYLLLFDVNGVPVNPGYTQWVIADAQSPLPSPIIPPADPNNALTFLGYTNQIGTLFYDAQGVATTVSATRNATLYAHWEALVTFHGNGGMPVAQQDSTQNLRYNLLNIADPTWTGTSYLFMGWTNSLGTVVNHGDPYVTGENDLYAKWEVQVTFHDNNGSGIQQAAFTQNLCYDMGNINEPTWSGYVFTGWTNSIGEWVVDGDDYAPGEDDLYATWEILVTFHDNNGTPDTQDVLTQGLFYVLPDNEPLWSGYVFIGWADSNGNPIANGDPYVPGADNLYAVWMHAMLIASISVDPLAGEVTLTWDENDAPFPLVTDYIIEVCDDLASPAWTPCSVNALPTGLTYFPVPPLHTAVFDTTLFPLPPDKCFFRLQAVGQ